MGRIAKPHPLRPSTGPDDVRHALAVHIGKKLLALRQRDLVTLRDVADVTGLSNAFICQVENAQSVPSAETVWRLARAFKVDVNYFFEGFKG